MIHEIIFPSLISLLVLGPGFLVTVEGLHCYSCDQNSVLGVPDTCGVLATPTSQNTKTCLGAETSCMLVTATPSASATPTLKLGCAGELEGLLIPFLGDPTLRNFCDKAPETGCRALPDVPASSFLPALRDIKICCCSHNLLVKFLYRILFFDAFFPQV